MRTHGYVSAYYYIGVHILLYVCPHTTICPHATIYVSSWYICPYTIIHVILRLVARYAWNWVCRWRPHHFLGISSMLSVSDVGENKKLISDSLLRRSLTGVYILYSPLPGSAGRSVQFLFSKFRSKISVLEWQEPWLLFQPFRILEVVLRTPVLGACSVNLREVNCPSVIKWQVQDHDDLRSDRTYVYRRSLQANLWGKVTSEVS